MALFLLLIFLIPSIIYSGNLNSGFILDDWPNLEPLNTLPENATYLDYIQFLANNTSGQLGRPISLLSFALQSENWPKNPFAFKAINLILHIINGALVTWVCALILKQCDKTFSDQRWLPVMVGGLWLIQPIHVSTVLYTIQRMTLLMALFSLLALCGYLYGRNRCYSKPGSGLFISTFALITGGLLAVFSKENGVILLLYMAVIELTLFNRQPLPEYWQAWRICCVFIPVLSGGLYILYHIQTYINGHIGRSYSFSEHLMTDGRILLNYVGKILLPRPSTFGLFFDDYPISTGLLTPPATLLSLLSIAILLVLAWAIRKKQPVFSFAVLWFFAGHALESSFIPLELYFEHRNYLPSLGIIFGLCFYFLYFLQKASSTVVKSVFIALAWIYLLGIGFICFNEASLWGHPAQQALNWQSEHPKSKRANALAAQTWVDLNKPRLVDRYLRNITAIDPQDSASLLMRLELHCVIHHLSPAELSEIPKHLLSSSVENATVLTAKSLVKRWISHQCSSLSPEYIEQVLTTILSRSVFAKHKKHLASTLSLFYAAQNHYPQAIKLLNRYIEAMPEATELILLKIRWGIASQQYQKALQWIHGAKAKNDLAMLNNVNFHHQLEIMEKDIISLQQKPANLKEYPITHKLQPGSN